MPDVVDDEIHGGLPTPPVPKAALVTGGARDIGRALALVLAEEGFAVAVHDHESQEEATALVSSIEESGGRAVALAADLADEAAVERLLPQAAAALGPIGVLVNNASVFGNDTLATATRDSWDAHMAVNLRAPFVLTQQFARLLPIDAGGVVVNLLDERVWNLTPYFSSYTLTKSALLTLTRTAALALAPRIRVNGIKTGPRTEMAQKTNDFIVEQRHARAANSCDVGKALRFILTSPSMTGQFIALYLP